MMAITLHAVVRYAQRVLRLYPDTMDDMAVDDALGEAGCDRIAAVISEVTADAAKAFGSVTLTCGGVSYVVRAGRVVTVTANGAVDLDGRQHRLAVTLKAWWPRHSITEGVLA
ncbi:hypothetical protein FHK98_01300 [Cylindrospermopsis raciborskii CS-506_A]|uniref:Uncharacterized protein n=1 Tax=Cylindrospermopsis raciborskii CS-506_A TaxID=2585140 RepID=A0A838WD89_9CYAN|nr:hypothetical protein [Cylindrospermopsis raciborskii]MBA4464578.1 hypothetical protein [Cylindrospermopsis raciborskii CS-506_A]